MTSSDYTAIVVGSGFASSFFLHRFLEHAGDDVRILVLERGPMMDHADQIARVPETPLDGAGLVVSRGAAGKTWRFSVGFGGGSNCWWACTPRMMPADFEMRTRYGVGEDWPISYDELERYYCEAEEIMATSGPAKTPYPMSRPYPQPPHEFSEPDKLLHQAFGDAYIPQPTARSRLGTDNRAPCCANAVCSLCPVNAKFTVETELFHVYEDPRVTLKTDAEVLSVTTEGGRATGVTYREAGREVEVGAEMVALGANAMFNASILLASGFDDYALGRFLHEQCAIEARVYLNGVRNFTGSTSITGNGFMFYDGPHRAERAGCLVESVNRVRPRHDYGKWADVTHLKLIYEDLPLAENRVTLPTDGSGKPVATTEKRSDYLAAGLATARETFEKLFAPLPVDHYELHNPTSNEAHVLGTARMGTDPATSVVDADLVHHKVRNLLVLGGSSFVTGAPSNPTVTISSLSLRAADRLLGLS
ncbi:GMC family oxidoreductase [Rhodobacteraceae bacterium NNCM2]|nr:GMC family oxidoreductase [Coraliihabitans acroporae]